VSQYRKSKTGKKNQMQEQEQTGGANFFSRTRHRPAKVSRFAGDRKKEEHHD